MRIGLCVLTVVACIGTASSVQALEPVSGKEYKQGSYIHGTWPSTVLAKSCSNPVYLGSGYLQGVWYEAQWYCAPALSKLWIRPYQTGEPLQSKN